MTNYYESCIPCNDCNLPFLPKDVYEEVCPECQSINYERERAREEEERADSGTTD